jgi:hypothetical protein
MFPQYNNNFKKANKLQENAEKQKKEKCSLEIPLVTVTTCLPYSQSSLRCAVRAGMN